MNKKAIIIKTALLVMILMVAGNSVVFGQWSTGGSNIYWNGAGVVGIGTSTPTSGYKLDVVGAGAKMRLYSNSAPSSAQFEVSASGVLSVLESTMTPSSQGRVGTRGNYNFSLFTNDLDRFTVRTDGNVGIGNSNPTYKLDVNGIANATTVYVGLGATPPPAGYKVAVGGKIMAEEVVIKLQANWPDYVFATDYQLPTIEELQIYIAKNRHLPGIPSAEIVEEEGLKIGEMNVELVKKMEELTLYIIQLKEEVNQLNAKIKTLEKK